jgi:hypothetical protein
VTKRDPLWELCSKFIRMRAMDRCGGCERCWWLSQLGPKSFRRKASWKELQAAHCFGRNARKVKYDIDNIAGLCGGCHLYIDSQHDAKEGFFRALLGDGKYEMLQMRKEQTHPKIDKAAIKLFLKSEIKKLGGGER